MEKLVREELERWDSEASMNRGDASPAGSRAATAKSSRGSPSRASQASAASVRTVSIYWLFVNPSLLIKHNCYKNIGNDHQVKDVSIVEQILLISVMENV